MPRGHARRSQGPRGAGPRRGSGAGLRRGAQARGAHLGSCCHLAAPLGEAAVLEPPPTEPTLHRGTPGKPLGGGIRNVLDSPGPGRAGSHRLRPEERRWQARPHPVLTLAGGSRPNRSLRRPRGAGPEAQRGPRRDPSPPGGARRPRLRSAHARARAPREGPRTRVCPGRLGHVRAPGHARPGVAVHVRAPLRVRTCGACLCLFTCPGA